MFLFVLICDVIEGLSLCRHDYNEKPVIELHQIDDAAAVTVHRPSLICVND